MLRIENRQMFRSNGLIDDLVIYGAPADYVVFAEQVQAAFGRGKPVVFQTASHIQIEILETTTGGELFTSLQNQDDFYASMDDWSERTVLRVRGDAGVLETLRRFLIDLSGRGDGYSYISEYSVDLAYASDSPQWRLHVQLA